MNLYKTSVETADDGVIQIWSGTQYDARQAEKKLKAEYPMTGKKPETTDVDFPTDKPGLLAWLNDHFDRDNG